MACNFAPPFDHSAPIYHMGPGGRRLLLHEWPDECLWAQLQYERCQRDRDPGNYGSVTYLEGLEVEWLRRNLCSRCHRDMDRSIAEQHEDLTGRAEDAERKLADIRAAIARQPDLTLRPVVMSILDRP